MKKIIIFLLIGAICGSVLTTFALKTSLSLDVETMIANITKMLFESDWMFRSILGLISCWFTGMEILFVNLVEQAVEFVGTENVFTWYLILCGIIGNIVVINGISRMIFPKKHARFCAILENHGGKVFIVFLITVLIAPILVGAMEKEVALSHLCKWLGIAILQIGSLILYLSRHIISDWWEERSLASKKAVAS